MPPRPHALWCPLLALVMAGCTLTAPVLPTPTPIKGRLVKTTPSPSPSQSPVLPTILPSDAPPAPVVSLAPTLPVVNPVTPVIGNNGGAVIANNGAALTGIVRLPAGLISQNGASYRIAATAPTVEVALVDAQEQLLPGTDWVKTDAEGRYTFETVPTAGTFYVRARLTVGDKEIRLAALGKLAAEKGTTLDITPASSIVAEKTLRVVAEQDLDPNAFDPARVRTLEAETAQFLTSQPEPDFSRPGAELAAALDRLIQKDADLATAARALDRNVGTPIVRTKGPFAGGIFSPEHLAYDPQGNLFVAGLNDHTVYKIAAGTTTPVKFATVRFPHGVACDPQGNVYVSRRIDKHHSEPDNPTPGQDTPGLQVYKIDPTGASVTPLNYTFSTPSGLAVSADGKMLYVVSYEGGGSLIRYDLEANQGTVLATELPYGLGVAFDSKGLAYVTHLRYDTDAKAWLGAITSVDAAGEKTLFYKGIKDLTGSDRLEGIVVDAADNLYATNNWGNTIFKFTPKQKKIETFLKFNQPTGLAFDPQGNLVVADYALGTLSKITP